MNNLKRHKNMHRRDRIHSQVRRIKEGLKMENYNKPNIKNNNEDKLMTTG